MTKTINHHIHLTVRMPEPLFLKLDDTAYKLRTNRAALIRSATEQYLKALEKAETLAA